MPVAGLHNNTTIKMRQRAIWDNNPNEPVTKNIVYPEIIID